VTEVLPRFSGKDLDNVVDYLNYVIVPAFILARSEVLPATVALPAAIAMALTSLYHFADNDSKTDAGQFVGFPAIWNIVVFYFFITGLPQWGAAAIVMLCASLTFVRLYWVHPFRYRRLRPLTAIVILAWGVAAIAALFGAFPSHDAIRAIFWIAAAYILALGFGSSLLARSRG
jgi:phosphatidylcholine synthase